LKIFKKIICKYKLKIVIIETLNKIICFDLHFRVKTVQRLVKQYNNTKSIMNNSNTKVFKNFLNFF